VCPVDSLPPGSQRSVLVGDRRIAVFNIRGNLYALLDRCPHQGALLSGGTVVGALSASGPGCYTYDGGRDFVKCPWHGWEFDLATGQSWCNPVKERVRPYPVSVQPGSELLCAPNEPDRIPGPYVAETVAVSIHENYVVLETRDRVGNTSKDGKRGSG
jgi:3-phenylpropionate/trans-cinnamate dioxygenase ferredoxin subunit